MHNTNKPTCQCKSMTGTSHKTYCPSMAYYSIMHNTNKPTCQCKSMTGTSHKTYCPSMAYYSIMHNTNKPTCQCKSMTGTSHKTYCPSMAYYSIMHNTETFSNFTKYVSRCRRSFRSSIYGPMHLRDLSKYLRGHSCRRCRPGAGRVREGDTPARGYGGAL